MTRENHIQDPIEENIQKAIEECQKNPKHGIVTLVFPTLPQHEVDKLHEEIEDVLIYHFDLQVHVDE